MQTKDVAAKEKKVCADEPKNAATGVSTWHEMCMFRGLWTFLIVLRLNARQDTEDE